MALKVYAASNAEGQVRYWRLNEAGAKEVKKAGWSLKEAGEVGKWYHPKVQPPKKASS